MFLSRLFGNNGSVIDGAEARRLVAEGAKLIDVRSPGEFSGQHLPGAVNMPVDRLGGLASKLDPKAPIVLYCASGARSARARQALLAAGFEQVHDLGSIVRW